MGNRAKPLSGNSPRRLCRLKKRRRYERNRNGEGSRPGRYGFTVRHMRCDRCQRDYLPQHMHRYGRQWYWECGNCLFDQGGGLPCPHPSRGRLHDARMRWRYRNDPVTLKALGILAVTSRKPL